MEVKNLELISRASEILIRFLPEDQLKSCVSMMLKGSKVSGLEAIENLAGKK